MPHSNTEIFYKGVRQGGLGSDYRHSSKTRSAKIDFWNTHAVSNFIFCTGGLVFLSDGNAVIYSAQKGRILPADPTPGANNSERSWFGFWMNDLVKRMNEKNLDKLGGDYVGWLLQNDDQLALLQHRPYYTPVNWDGGDIPNGREIGMLMATNLLVSNIVCTGCRVLEISVIDDSI